MSWKNKGTESRFAFVGLRQVILIAAIMLFYSDVFSGVIRYVWHSIGVEFLTYIPMITVSAVTILYLAYSGFRTVYDARITMVILFIFSFAVIGLFMGRAPEGVFFALYTWGPFFLGMMAVRFDLFPRIMKHVPLLTVLALAGVFVTALTTVPWMGGEGYSIGGVEVEITRNWDAFGVSRLPGFSRASYTAANHLTVFALWLLCTRMSVFWKAVLWGAAGYAILLTTSKTPLIVIAAAPPLLLGYTLLSRTGKWARVYSYGVVAVILAIMIGLPLMGEINKGGGRIHLPYDDIFPFLRMESFADRVENMWPNAFRLLDVDGPVAHVLGRGLSGIGVGQKFTEMDIINSGDNMHVFLYITFGMFSSLFYAALLLGHKRAMDRFPKTSQGMPPVFYLATVTAVLGLGTLTCVIESILPVFAFGAMVALCVAPLPARKVVRREPAWQLFESVQESTAAPAPVNSI